MHINSNEDLRDRWEILLNYVNDLATAENNPVVMDEPNKNQLLIKKEAQ